MINIIVAGAAGRMGQRIGAMVAAHPELNYAAGFEASGNPHIGKDAGEVAGFGQNGVTIAEGLESVIGQGDVISASGARNCRLQDFNAGRENCTQNLVVASYQ